MEKKGKICKNTWKGEECKLTDCKYVHIDPCEDRECLALMGGLPVWRSRNCQKWHIRPKSDKQKKPRRNGSSVKSASNGSSNAGPWKNQVQDHRNPKNNNGPKSFRSSYHHSTAPLQHAAVAGHPKKMSYSAVAQGMSGNAKAAFANKPLNRGGNQNPHQHWGQQVNQRGSTNYEEELRGCASRVEKKQVNLNLNDDLTSSNSNSILPPLHLAAVSGHLENSKYLKKI